MLAIDVYLHHGDQANIQLSTDYLALMRYFDYPV